MIICNPREADLFKTFSSLFIKLILELTKLAAAIRAKAIQMPRICKGHRVGLTARDRNNFLVCKGLDSCRIRLVRLVLGVFGQVTDVVKAELPKRGFAPGINVTFFCQSH